MTTPDQTKILIRIAEACGWHKEDKLWISATAEAWADEWHLPFQTLDQIQQAVLSQSEEFQREFAEALNRKAVALPMYSYIPLHHQLTALDWATAFVETLERMK